MSDVFFLPNIGRGVRALLDLEKRGRSCLEKVTKARMREYKRTLTAQKKEKKVPKIVIESLHTQLQ